MAALTAQVERSLVPGLRSIAVTRCPSMRAGITPAAFEMPELVPGTPTADTGSAAVAESPLAADDAPSEALVAAQGPASLVGTNVLLGGLYGLCSQVIRPRLHRMARRAGSLAPVVQIGGEAGAFGVAYAVVSVCKEAAKRVGGVVMKVPLLGANHPAANAFQYGLAALIGNKFGEMLLGGNSDESSTERVDNADQVFLANMCVMCNTQYTVSGGQRVAAFNCGHACLCTGGEAEEEPSCVTLYMEQRNDCPLCRTSPVHVQHEIRV